MRDALATEFRRRRVAGFGTSVPRGSWQLDQRDILFQTTSGDVNVIHNLRLLDPFACTGTTLAFTGPGTGTGTGTCTIFAGTCTIFAGTCTIFAGTGTIFAGTGTIFAGTGTIFACPARKPHTVSVTRSTREDDADWLRRFHGGRAGAVCVQLAQQILHFLRTQAVVLDLRRHAVMGSHKYNVALPRHEAPPGRLAAGRNPIDSHWTAAHNTKGDLLLRSLGVTGRQSPNDCRQLSSFVPRVWQKARRGVTSDCQRHVDVLHNCWASNS